MATQSAVDDSVNALRAAQARFQVLVGGGTVGEQGTLRAAVDSTGAVARAAEVLQERVRQGATTSQVAVAQQSEQAAQSAANSAQTTERAFCEAHGVAIVSCPIAQANAAVSQAVSIGAQRRQAAEDQGPGPADRTGAWAFRVGTAASAQAARAQLEQLNHPPPNALADATTAVQTAQANLDAARARQNELAHPTAAAVAKAQTAVETAENDQRAARVQLAELEAGGTPEQQAAADAQVEEARGLLDGQLAKRAGLRQPSEAELAAARAAVDSAQAALDKAERELAAMPSRTTADLQAASDGVEEAENSLYLARYPYRQEEIQQQREAVGTARATYELAVRPFRSEELTQAQGAVAQARGQRDLAVAQADEATVYAPFAGRIGTKYQDAGALASPVTPIVSVVTDSVRVWVNVDESELPHVGVGSPARLTVSTFPNESFDARVEAVTPAGDQKSRTFQTKLVPADRDGRLKDGMLAQVNLRGRELQAAVLLPAAAIVWRSGQSYTFVVVDGKAQRRAVDLGISDRDQCEVLAGVQPGEHVVSPAIDGLVDGDPVTVNPGERS
ncbi:MAG TPA: efflux RND transporter periplasmic adaptor subunit [Chloroflexota bacterium]